jgi:hypothetical protein
MKLPAEPEEEQEPKPNSDEMPSAEGKSKRKTKVVVYQGAPLPLPGQTSKKFSLIPGENAPSAKPDRSMEAAPEGSAQSESQPVRQQRGSDQATPPQSDQATNPGRRLRGFEAAAKEAPRARIPWQYRLRPTRESTHRAYWDVTTTISLIVNAILVGLIIIMALQIKNLKSTMNTLVNNVMGGLYDNFVKLDQASINTTIMVNAQIPLNFNLPVSQNTQVVLTNDVSIPGAHVVINTGVLNINAQATVTLPAGTALPIALNLNIPVQTSIPISLQVPVHIPMNQTELHEPFTGLETTLRPLYCAFNKNAQFPEGTYICAEHDTPTPVLP